MTPTNPPDALEAQARRRVGLKMGFYVHLTVYLLVNLGLFAIAGLTGRGGWPLFPLLGWGLGLAIHGIVVLLKLRGEGLRERMVASEVERLRRRP
ncbi:MAG TPA: 2TM domain-containing protein [Burkholderiaceae bacterium]|nr:2TM domain-containing protein [Burkholderiaceae bacterium]